MNRPVAVFRPGVEINNVPRRRYFSVLFASAFPQHRTRRILPQALKGSARNNRRFVGGNTLSSWIHTSATRATRPSTLSFTVSGTCSCKKSIIFYTRRETHAWSIKGDTGATKGKQQQPARLIRRTRNLYLIRPDREKSFCH